MKAKELLLFEEKLKQNQVKFEEQLSNQSVELSSIILNKLNLSNIKRIQ